MNSTSASASVNLLPICAKACVYRSVVREKAGFVWRRRTGGRERDRERRREKGRKRETKRERDSERWIETETENQKRLRQTSLSLERTRLSARTRNREHVRREHVNSEHKEHAARATENLHEAEWSAKERRRRRV